MNIKKKHHFVSQFYLRNWLSGSNKLCVWDGDKKYFFVGTENIAYRKSFYKIVKLKPKQITFFHELAKECKFTNLSDYESVVKPLLDTHKMISDVKQSISELGIERTDDNKEIFKDLDRLEQEFENNIIEDKFSYSEEMFSQVFKKIITSNISDIPSLNFNDYDVIAHFIAFQLGKTPQKFERITLDDGSDIRNNMMMEYDFSDDEYHTYTLYSLICFTEKIYLSILNRLEKINIYYNNSDTNFITSDDPCFNQKNDQKKFYVQIPISPKIMIELVENTEKNKEEMMEYYKYNKDNKDYIIVNDYLINFSEIGRNEVSSLNKKILGNKHQFIYASCEADITELMA